MILAPFVRYEGHCSFFGLIPKNLRAKNLHRDTNTKAVRISPVRFALSLFKMCFTRRYLSLRCFSASSTKSRISCTAPSMPTADEFTTR